MPAPVSLPGSLPIQGISLTRPAAGGFGTLLRDSIAHVEQMRQTADQSIARMLSGEGEELHTVALATQQAELAFDLFLQVRNKVVQAYEEVMRMQM